MKDEHLQKYVILCWIIVGSMLGCIVAIVLLNVLSFPPDVSISRLFVLQLGFWGALGGTVASSLFLKDDKEINELEYLKGDKADPTIFRLPDIIDASLYVQRIITSGVLAVVGFFALRVGAAFFDGDPDLSRAKHRAFFIALAFVTGLYQSEFLDFLKGWFTDVLKARKDSQKNLDQEEKKAQEAKRREEERKQEEARREEAEKQDEAKKKAEAEGIQGGTDEEVR